jgi:hypothetical protein
VNLTREQLLAGPRARQDTVDVDGGTVTVRGLTRAEAVQVAACDDGSPEQEQTVLRLGLVDPQLDETDVKAWYGVALAGDIQTVCLAIQAMSGMDPGAPKEVTKSAAHRRQRR